VNVDYRRLFDASPSPYLVLTVDLTIVAANRSYAEATMFDTAAMLGRPMFEVFPDNPDLPGADAVRNTRRSLETVLRTAAPDTMAVQRYDIRDPAGGFGERYWSVINTPVRDVDGRVELIILRAQDVTALVQAEGGWGAGELRGELAQMRDDLFTRSRELQEANVALREVNADLEALAAALHGRQRAGDRFIAVLSHELRNSLAATRAAIDLLLLDSPVHPAVQVLARQCTVLTRMVDDLLDAARAGTGRLDVVRHPLELGELVRRVVAETAAVHARRAGPPVVEVPAAVVPVDGDATRLAQLLANLLANADRHAGEGATVTVTLAVDGGWVSLVVRDDGRGFDPAFATTLFEPFRRVGAADGARSGGIGLGLAIVRGIAEAHGGTVAAHSDGDGAGAVFTVRLPLRGPTPEATPDTAPATPLRPATRPPLRVLLVDAHRDAAHSTAGMFARRGDVVTLAHSGPEAVVEAGWQRFDLVLCDLGPGDDRDGLRVAARLRRIPAQHRTRMVALSGSARNADRALEADFDAHLAKPLDPDRLERLLADWTHDWTRPLPRPDGGPVREPGDWGV
jgi:signal transduction histidine kinase/CheY-like chemotaxis protein